MAKAYLVIELEPNDGSLPSIKHVSIQSSGTLPPNSAVLTEAEGKSFQEAGDNLHQLINSFQPFAWVKPWIEATNEAYLRRFELVTAMRPLMEAISVLAARFTAKERMDYDVASLRRFFAFLTGQVERAILDLKLQDRPRD